MKLITILCYNFLHFNFDFRVISLPLQVFVKMFRGSRMKVGRTVDQEKIIAQTFVKFLEDENRKEDMFVHELKQIYQEEYRSLYETLGMSFSKLLNTLTYRLNLCQRLQDRVIFGGGDAAALQLLANDPDESEEDEGDFFSYMRHGAYYCKVCKRDLGSPAAYRSHLAGVKHRQQHILRKIRKSLQK